MALKSVNVLVMMACVAVNNIDDDDGYYSIQLHILGNNDCVVSMH